MSGHARQPSPALLLLLLGLTGTGLGIWLHGRALAPSPETPAPPAVAPTEDLAAQVRLLEGQVEYLQGQNAVLEEENARLQQRLAQGTSTGAARPASSDDDADPPDFAGLSLDLLKFRRLQALPLTVTTASQAEVEARILDWLRRRQPGDEAPRLALALHALGWIDRPVDPLPLRAALLARQLGGWYDSGSGVLHVVDAAPAPGKPAPDRPLAVAYGQLLREYGSVLFPEKARLSTDARLAREALMAGDAGLTRFLFSLENPTGRPPKSIPAEDPDHPLNEVALPVFLRELYLHPFNRGFEFARDLHGTGGFAQLDAAYSRPPSGAAELADPASFLSDQTAEPNPLSLPQLTAAGAPPYWDDCLGPFACQTALRAYNSDEVAAAAVRGWRGDRLLAFAAPEHARDHALWQTLWQNEAQAGRFHTALRTCLLQRWDVEAEPGNETTLVLHPPGRSLRLQINQGGRGVLLIDAADDATASALQEAVNAVSADAP
jgi:hypothetical protein